MQRRYVPKPVKILPNKETRHRLGDLGRTCFYETFVKTGRLKPVRISQRRIGFVEDEVDAVVAKIAAARGK